MKNRWLRITALTAGWAFLGLVLTLEIYFNVHAEMDWPDFTMLAIPQFGRAAMWACMTPFILLLREKMPLSSGRWVGGILFHFLFSFAVMADYYLGRTESYRIFFDENTYGFWHSAIQNFYGYNFVDMACYWAVIAFGYGGELQRKFKNEEVRAAQLESRLIEAELKALREQLKPHFLFNTLNTVSAMVRDGKNEMAVTLLARLGSLLRMSLDSNHDNETTLRVEMDFLERYIEIQKARYSDRLTVNIAVSDEALGVSVPWLLLQPIVENAILHGVAPKVGPGRVDITGGVKGTDLTLSVRDDGPGVPDGRRVLEGTGLTNTRERLTKLYGDRGRLEVKGHPSGGFSVEITLPSRS
ncbi:MAG TPA: histidine kinase [Opitutaceae bacterium]|nr:histidine kinase [Opitutaceae bacterium]